MSIAEYHPELARRFTALVDPTDDSDWLDVRRRSRVLSPSAPPARVPTGLRRMRAFAAVAGLGLAAAAGAPAVGLGHPFSAVAHEINSLFGNEPEENFSTHDGRSLPIYLSVGRTADGGSSDLVQGKVFSSEIASLQLKLADGRVVDVALDSRRQFRYTAGSPRPVELVARDSTGKVVTRLPVIHP